LTTKRVKSRLPVVLVCGAVLFTLPGCRKPDARESDSFARLAQTIVEGVHRNLECHDFTFRLKITRSFPNGNSYSKTFQFYGILTQPEQKVFAESISEPRQESSRYLLSFKDGKLVSAQMFSPQFGDIETRENEQDLNKITFGDLSYPEFRHMASLQPSDFDQLTEEPQYFVVHSRVKDLSGNAAEESMASRFVYHIEKESYLPARIEFFNQRAEFKEFNLEAKELVGGRWVIRQGRVKDFLDQSETVLEFGDFHFDEGVDAKVFRAQNLKSYR
jgi:hypothetical protein